MAEPFEDFYNIFISNEFEQTVAFCIFGNGASLQSGGAVGRGEQWEGIAEAHAAAGSDERPPVVLGQLFEEEDFDGIGRGRLGGEQSGGPDAGIVDYQQVIVGQQVREFEEVFVGLDSGGSGIDEEFAMIAGMDGELGDGVGRKGKIETRNLHDKGDTC